MKENQFVQHLHEVFSGFGKITTRRMFGGWGIYRDGLMFALVADDTLYLKADAGNAPHFDALGLDNFEYVKNGKAMKLSYRCAPDVMLEDREQAAIWARRAFDAALRARANKSKTGK
ncbi:MAG: TfoX/Sxy family protein [Burkholderiales bacterium]